MKYKRVLLVDELNEQFAKIDASFIDWRASDVAENRYGWFLRFITEHGKTYKTKNIFCENEYTARELLRRTQHHLAGEAKYGDLYVFCIAPDAKDGSKQVQYYTDGAMRPVLYQAKEFYKNKDDEFKREQGLKE